jgi:dipeptide/tripeptide permease
MKPRRPVLLLLALAVAVSAERFAYYGLRSTLPMMLRTEMGLDAAKVARTFALAGTLSLLAIPFGGVLAWLLGSRTTAAIGTGIAMVGMMGVVAGAPLPSFLIVALGAGIFRAAPLTAIAEELEPLPGRAQRAAALAIGIYGLANLTAMFASPITGAVAASVGFRAAAALCLLSSITALVAAGLSHLAPRVLPDFAPRPILRPGEDLPYRGNPVVDASPRAVSFGIVALAVILLGSAMAAQTLGSEVAMSTLEAARERTTRDLGMLYTLNPIVVVGTSVIAGALLYATAGGAGRLKVGWALGGGALLLAVGSIGLAVVPAGAVTLPWIVVAAGEAVCIPVGLAVVTLAVPPRYAGFAAGGASFVTYAAATWGSQVARALQDADVRATGGAQPGLVGLTLFTAVVVLVVGVVSAAIARAFAARGFD